MCLEEQLRLPYFNATSTGQRIAGPGSGPSNTFKCHSMEKAPVLWPRLAHSLAQ